MISFVTDHAPALAQWRLVMVVFRKACVVSCFLSLFTLGCVGDLFEGEVLKKAPKTLGDKVRESKAPLWCENTYLTGKSGTRRVCSTYPLTEEQLKVVYYQLGYTIDLYQKWIGNQGYEYHPRETVSPHFFFITMSVINDRKVFTRADNTGQVAGRYIPTRGWIFLTERAFTRDGYSDIPHEVCHWLNSNLGISKDPKEDERLCRKFEKHYENILPWIPVERTPKQCRNHFGTIACD